MTCKHSNIKKYKVKGTNKIKWICQDCGSVGYELPSTRTPQTIYPHIVGGETPRASIRGEGIGGYKNITDNLQDGMKDLNKGIRGMPHLIIGENKDKNDDKKPQQPMFTEKEMKIWGKIKKWTLELAILAVVVYAITRFVKLNIF